MLTKEVISIMTDRYARNELTYHGIKQLANQAALAIDLTDQVTNLQAALDAIHIDVSGGVNPCKECKFRRWLNSRKDEIERLRDEIAALKAGDPHA